MEKETIEHLIGEYFYDNGDFNVQVVEIIRGRTNLWGKLIDGNKN